MLGIRTILLSLMLVAACVLPRALHAVVAPICCVCTACPAAATVCVTPTAGDTAPDTIGDGGAAAPPSPCSSLCPGCATSQIVGQSCADLLQCHQPAHAPATSHHVLAALGVVLAAYGVVTVRRRRSRT